MTVASCITALNHKTEDASSYSDAGPYCEMVFHLMGQHPIVDNLTRAIERSEEMERLEARIEELRREEE